MKLIALCLFAVLHCISGEVDNKDDSKEIHKPPLLWEKGKRSSKLDQFFQWVINKEEGNNGGYIPAPKLVYVDEPFYYFRADSGKFGNISDFRRTEKYHVFHHKYEVYYVLSTVFELDVVNYYSTYKLIELELSSNGNIHAEAHKVQFIFDMKMEYTNSSCNMYILHRPVNIGEVRVNLTSYESPENAKSATKKLELYLQNNKQFFGLEIDKYASSAVQEMFDNYVNCKDLKALLKDFVDNQDGTEFT